MATAEERRQQNLRPVSVTNNLGSGIFGTPRTGPGPVGTAMGLRPATPPTSSYGPYASGYRFPSSSTSNSGGSGGGGSRNLQAQEAPAASAAPSAGRINWRDSAYNAQIAAIQRALQDFETGAQTRGERYGQDFTTGLQRLGYRPGEGFQAMPNILEAMAARTAGADGAEGEMGVAFSPLGGSFDIEGVYDPYTAAAQGTRGLRDDFAGRGMLRSSGFARNFGEFQNRLNQQLEAMETGRTRFGQDLSTEVSRERTLAEERRQQAQRDAMLRAATAAAGGGGF
jgi:hypothetical protein